VSEEDHAQDLEDLTKELRERANVHSFEIKQLEQELHAAHGKIAGLEEEVKRKDMAYKFMAQNLAQHVERNTLLGNALNTSTVLIDGLMADLRLADRPPSAALQAAHLKWNEAMKKLFGHDR
jgi:chromosome segregation ATPase